MTIKFDSLRIIEPILEALKKIGYSTPTPIQEKTIPLLLDNKDVIGIAQTGTGKTAAFVIPILQKLHLKPSRIKSPRALVLAPTRELAAQIGQSFRIYGKFLNLKHVEVYGGVPINPQIRALSRGVDILVATPGRLMDLMNQGEVDLDKIDFFVLDEADRMLDMGFLRDVRRIEEELPTKKQSLFFSATMSNAIINLTKDFLRNPAKVQITPQATPVEKINQCVYFVDQNDKIELLFDLYYQDKMDCVLLFVKGKHRADKIARLLSKNRIPTDSIHGNKSQAQRTRALRDFKSGKIKILVATDIAARGIDVNNISHVVNFDLPNEAENYVHRIGRTARAGKRGSAYSFCAAEDRSFLNEIEKITKKEIPAGQHKYHSHKAKDATGVNAKPKPRTSRFNRVNRINPRAGYKNKESSRDEGRGSSRGRKGSSSGGNRFGSKRRGSSSGGSRFGSRDSGSGGRRFGSKSRSSGSKDSRKFGSRFGARKGRR
jgi:ATP-dependent RNA helicase RhlE